MKAFQSGAHRLEMAIKTAAYVGCKPPHAVTVSGLGRKWPSSVLLTD